MKRVMWFLSPLFLVGCMETNPLYLTDGRLTIDSGVLLDTKSWFCSPSTSQTCYSGPVGTENIGLCRAGIQTCVSPQNVWGNCVGEVLPAAEICDGLDNDCDGPADENWDLQTDVSNCGVCGNVCKLDNATSTCNAGSCKVVTCATGYYDADGKASNGCEYVCTVSNGAIDVCDSKDNDCDGKVDNGCKDILLHLDGTFTPSGGVPKAWDRSGNKHFGDLFPSYLNGPKSVSGGVVGKAIQFDGKDDYIQIPDIASMKIGPSFTVMVWVKVDATMVIGKTRYIFWKNDDQPGIFLRDMSTVGGTGIKWIFLTQWDKALYSSKKASLGMWVHLAITYKGGAFTAYINGVKDDSRAAPFISGGVLRIGADGAAGRYFKGLIDEVVIVKAARTAAQIERHYDLTKPKP